MATIDEARSAKSVIKFKLEQDFADATLIKSIDLSSVAADYIVKVELNRQPTAQEKPLLPDAYYNVKIIYDVTGKKDCAQPGHVCSCSKGPK